jgi:hypothetical protein
VRREGGQACIDDHWLVMSVKCFMIEPNGTAQVSLRRYHSSPPGAKQWTCEDGWHEAMVPIGKCREWKQPEPSGGGWLYENDSVPIPRTDPRWPAQCKCNYVFTDDDTWQVFTDRIYVDLEGAEYSLRNAPPGALWWAEWLEGLEHWWKGPDGHILMAQTPGGQWCIDSRASNCTMPKDDEHRCWIRHGTPPEITVDKNGKTCAAGAGSIISGNYHGFLQNGYFT